MIKLENDAGEEIDTTNAWCTFEETEDENGNPQTKVIIEGLDESTKNEFVEGGKSKFYGDAFEATGSDVAFEKFEEEEEPEVNFEHEFDPTTGQGSATIDLWGVEVTDDVKSDPCALFDFSGANEIQKSDGQNV